MNYSEMAHSVKTKFIDGDVTAAQQEAICCVESIFKEYNPSGEVTATFERREVLGVACDRHLRLSIHDRSKVLAMPERLISASFSNAINSFQTIATLCETYPVRNLTSGAGVIDIEDGSNQGSYPRIAFCSALAQAELIIDEYYVAHRGYATLRREVEAAWIPWDEREPKVCWRGSTTGIQSSIPEEHEWHWRWLPRLHLCDVVHRSYLRDHFDVGVINTVQVENARAKDAILASGFMRPALPRLSFINFRYLIDIDGNANAWNGFFGALLMGACIFKVKSPHGFRQWYYDRLIPGVHYLSIKSDLSNLNDAVAWAIEHPDQCSEIARRARNFALSMNYEDEVDQSGIRFARLLALSNSVEA